MFAFWLKSVLSKEKPIKTVKGFQDDTEDDQKRFIQCTFGTKSSEITIMNGYFPQGENIHHETKFPKKIKYYDDLHKHIKALKKTEQFGADILKYCVKVGGVLTGEHGVGIEKRELMCEMFNHNDIQQQIKIKKSLDLNSLLNPGKVYPILRKCAEEGRVHVHGGKTKFPDIPRF